MLLKSIKLKNFRQFKGEQPPILFSTDPVKNVTVVMGKNDSGKTTLAQAFTWCLYGDTDFEDKSMLCTAVANSMLPNKEELVRVELDLIHNDIDYSIIREQYYSKDGNGNMRKPGQGVFTMAYKNKDGQREFVRDLDTEIRMKEILPKELSKYFFFDGERISNMGKQIRRGKSQEFARAVRNLLGLSAFTAVLNHLKGKTTRISVIRSYDESYDVRSDSRVAEYTKQIETLESEIEEIDKRLEEIENEQLLATDKCDKLREIIDKNKESEPLTRKKNSLIKNKDALISRKATSGAAVIKSFNNFGPSYFTIKLMKDALERLTEVDQIDKGIPDIHQRTIEFLIHRGKCICGTDINLGNNAYKELVKVLDYIPPHSIGTLISQFVRDCEIKCKSGDNLFDDVKEKYSIIRSFENDYAEVVEDISKIEKKLEGMDDIGEYQRDLKKYEHTLDSLTKERDQHNRSKGSKETSRDRANTERNELTLKDANNRKIETYKAYAQYMHDVLKEEYEQQEKLIRIELEKTVNEIFQSIFDGEFSLLIDEKYNIRVVVNSDRGYIEDVETGNAKRISIIFAFIAGVIKMARKSRNPENELLVSEPYPLVMDAPLSAFDKTRIKTVCDTIPSIAEQVIIFIKDTDGELAEEFMGNKVGMRYQLKTKNPFESYFSVR